MRKKLIALALTLGMTAAFVPFANAEFTTVNASAETFVIEDGMLLEYKLDESSIVIPDTVTSIDTHAFWRCTELTAITIPKTVTAIGDNAFPYSDRLKEVYYNGSKADWNRIQIGADNDILVNATIHYNNQSAPLAIAAQPKDLTAAEGETATFTVKATGEGLRYQWQLSDDGGQTWRDSKTTTNTYSVTVGESNDGRSFRCIVTDQNGASVTSNAAKLTITAAPKDEPSTKDESAAEDSISEEYGDEPAFSPDVYETSIIVKAERDSVPVGETAVFTATVPEVSGTLWYQWEYSDDGGDTWQSVKGDTNTFSVVVTEANNGGWVRCMVMVEADDTSACYLSNPAVINGATMATTKQHITQFLTNCADWIEAVEVEEEPIEQELNIPTQRQLVLTVDKEMFYGDIGYTWMYRLPNETVADYHVDYDAPNQDTYTATLTEEKNECQLMCLINDSWGMRGWSSWRILKTPDPKITSQPVNVKAAIGSQVQFAVEAIGTDLTYQWYEAADGEGTTLTDGRNTGRTLHVAGLPIDGAQNAAYITTLTDRNSGRRFFCVVTDKFNYHAVSDTAGITTVTSGMTGEVSHHAALPPAANEATEQETAPAPQTAPHKAWRAPSAKAAKAAPKVTPQTADLPAMKDTKEEVVPTKTAAESGNLTDLWQFGGAFQAPMAAEFGKPDNSAVKNDAPDTVIDQYLPSVRSNALAMNISALGIAMSLACAVIRKHRRRFLAAKPHSAVVE